MGKFCWLKCRGSLAVRKGTQSSVFFLFRRLGNFPSYRTGFYFPLTGRMSMLKNYRYSTHADSALSQTALSLTQRYPRQRCYICIIQYTAKFCNITVFSSQNCFVCGKEFQTGLNYANSWS